MIIISFLLKRAILQKLANVTLNKKIYLAELTFSYQ